MIFGGSKGCAQSKGYSTGVCIVNIQSKVVYVYFNGTIEHSIQPSKVELNVQFSPNEIRPIHTIEWRENWNYLCNIKPQNFVKKCFDKSRGSDVTKGVLRQRYFCNIPTEIICSDMRRCNGR